jgi:hypothetical protein
VLVSSLWGAERLETRRCFRPATSPAVPATFPTTLVRKRAAAARADRTGADPRPLWDLHCLNGPKQL